MNTAVRFSYVHAWSQARVWVRSWRWVHGPLTVMLSAAMISALSMVYVANNVRVLNAQMQRTLTERDAMHVEWQKLILEQSTMTARVRYIAQHKLGMTLPDHRTVIMLTESSSE